MSSERNPSATTLRRAFRSKASRRVFAWWSGMVAAGVAAFLALDGHWVACVLCCVVSAALLWLGGFWVWPRSSDAYVRRVMYAWQAWAVEVDWAYAAYSARESRYRKRIERLSAPPSRRSEFERLLATLSDAEQMREDRSIDDADRARRTVEAIRAISALADELCGATEEAEEQRFCQALRQAREERRAEYRIAAEGAERATEQLLAKLARMRQPSGAQEGHVQMCHGFNDYLQALRRLHAASREEAPDEAARAATSLRDARVALRSSGRSLRESLGYNDRWPLDEIDGTEQHS